jgi:hypothetical protein
MYLLDKERETKMVNEINIKQIVADAKAAGENALRDALPQPMLVAGGSRPYLVEGGVCGFAWVNVYGIRSNSKLGKALTTLGFRKSDYHKSFQFWVFDGGQSMERKEAYAYAMADVLQKSGLRAYAGSRMD